MSTQYQTRMEFLRYVKNRLNLGSKNPICEKHKNLFKEIKNEESIITLNYDLVVDNVLSKLQRNDSGGLDNGQLKSGYWLIEVRTPYGGRLSSSLPIGKGGFYIKLHGSIDWLYCPNPDCFNNKHFLPNYIDSPDSHNNIGDPCRICGTGYDIAIVPPSMKKSFEKFPKLGLLWHVAFEKLRGAETIIMIGMSLPESDYYLRWLIREAMIKRDKPPILIIVNTEESDVYKAKKLIGVEKAKWFKGLLKFIEEECEGDV